MRQIFRSIFPLLCVAVIFSGCLDVYFEIIPLPNGTYKVRRTMVITKTLADFANMERDTVNQKQPFIFRAMADELHAQFSGQRGTLAVPGMLSHGTFDTVTQNEASMMTEYLVKQDTFVPAALQHLVQLSASSQTVLQETVTDFQIPMSIHRTADSIAFGLTIDVPRSNKVFGFPDEEKSKILFFSRNEGIHFVVRSPQPVVLRTKGTIHKNPDGVEWYLPFNELLDTVGHKIESATFVIKTR